MTNFQHLTPIRIRLNNPTSMSISHKPYKRRKSSEVKIGEVVIGGSNPVAIQSMTNTPTMDAKSSADQVVRIANAGADIVRLTAQTPLHAANLAEIHKIVEASGVKVPLVADIHFNPDAAFEAAKHVEKVRINPGNFNISKFEEFVEKCRQRGVAIRIGVNHGSLSERIMNKYGDTPEGMVESAMEFLRICRNLDFKDVVISIKASNVVVMTATVRLLVETMAREGMEFPLHLGVTEAGDAEDGRIKSAVGIGSLLADGIGDTIRVSLTEDPECEIPVARMILEHIDSRMEESIPAAERAVDVSAVNEIPVVEGFDGEKTEESTLKIRVEHPNVIDKAVAAMPQSGSVSITAVYPKEMSAERVLIAASVDLGYLLLKYPLSGIAVEGGNLSKNDCDKLALDILQATRRRISKTEYIACPSCGRTLFDLQTTLAKVKQATRGMKGLKIGVMGCIVNGPGEMADADYGYVGAGPGRVSLYRGKECVEKNIPADEALPKLIALIKADGHITE